MAIDGKSLRHSFDTSKELRPLHLVSARVAECHISLGQVATEEKSNEITAIPELLDHIDIEDAIATIDAPLKIRVAGITARQRVVNIAAVPEPEIASLDIRVGLSV